MYDALHVQQAKGRCEAGAAVGFGSQTAADFPQPGNGEGPVEYGFDLFVIGGGSGGVAFKQHTDCRNQS